MDISVHISTLLYEQDCIIIPNFGGLVCNYRAADIHPVTHQILPPCKAITFNRLLQNNDGLLVNHLCEKEGINPGFASQLISNWVSSAKSLLQAGEQLNLQNIGSLKADVEGNWLFEQDKSTNFLKSAIGLRIITAEPVLRGKEIDFTEKFKSETKHEIKPRRNWRWAAVAALLLVLVGVAQLMWVGKDIAGLKLNEAGVLHFLNRITNIAEPKIKPMPVYETEVVGEVDTTATHNDVAANEPSEPNVTEYKEPVFDNTVAEEPQDKKYYIMVGAYREPQNIEAAIARLQEKFPDSVILIERGKSLTKLGFSAGNTYREAFQKLQSAWQDDSTYWLLKK